MAVSSTSGQGRPKGVPNKSTADIKALAQSFGPAAILKLAGLAGLLRDDDGNPIPAASSEQTQVAANKELLDRGFGKAMQPLGGDTPDGSLIIKLVKFAGDNPSE